jgi:hypothetical protein
MKHFLIAFLIAAISTVALVSSAHAASRYCYYNPDDPDCYNQGGYDDGEDDPVPLPPPPRPRYDDNDYGNDDGGYEPPQPRRPRPVARPVSRCETIAVNLQRSGYRRVRPLDCSGANYKFEAFRRGGRYILKIKSSNGRIVYEIRN